ncbi:MAG: DMT family transporter [Chloroflexota bacterium]
MEQGLIVVVLGLAAALGWGTGDFAGGVLSRRNPVYGVMLAFQGVGLAVAVVMVIVRAEPLPSSHDLVFALVTGSVGVVGVTILYHGLAVGRMGVVAPTAGVIGASIPVGAGMVLQGVPQPVAVAGIALALVSVVLVTRSPGHDGDGPSGWQWGIAAGALTGISFTTLAQVSAASTFSVLAVLRVEALLGIGLFVLVLRRPWRVARGDARLLAGAGLLDVVANAAYLGAATTGMLAIAAMLSSLYPVVTVILALGLLRERLGRGHLVGIVLAATAIVLIALGTTAA